MSRASVFILPKQVRGFHENSVKMIQLRATILSKKKMSRLTKSPGSMHVACVGFYTTESGERFS
jgi:hypothetical protein